MIDKAAQGRQKKLSGLSTCLDAIASGGFPQDRLGALTVVELNSPRVAPLHRFDSRLLSAVRCIFVI
ncbi:hypothetical protein [Moorena sp. SIO2C4]|uniref:hypothetical protein n=1 Tax=Moorena sp. SIO2C4 TaxID=2607824 RepID=UPI0002EE4F5E|nr:hypothetical protein [Moorena sp. SIO2C4]NEQ12853.1 hypothetical protein [Moorena sp. SIO3E2]NES43311.1 hypothetical protein [Moorena sp. SIO2C4]